MLASGSDMYLIVKSGPAAGAVHQVSHQGARIGRDPACEVRLDDGLTSKLHAEVFVDLLSGEFVVRDLGSKNGIRVNGEPVTEKPIRAGDEIRLGRSRILCSEEAPVQDLAGAPRPLQALVELARLAAEADPLDSLDALAARVREALLAKGAAIAVHEDGVSEPLMVAHATGRRRKTNPETVVLTRSGLSRRKERESAEEEPPPLPDLMRRVAETRREVLVEDASLQRQPGVMEGRIRTVLVKPLIVDESLHGVLELYWSDVGLDPAARAHAEIAASLVGLALRRALG